MEKFPYLFYSDSSSQSVFHAVGNFIIFIITFLLLRHAVLIDLTPTHLRHSSILMVSAGASPGKTDCACAMTVGGHTRLRDISEHISV